MSYFNKWLQRGTTNAHHKTQQTHQTHQTRNRSQSLDVTALERSGIRLIQNNVVC